MKWKGERDDAVERGEEMTYPTKRREERERCDEERKLKAPMETGERTTRPPGERKRSCEKIGEEKVFVRFGYVAWFRGELGEGDKIDGLVLFIGLVWFKKDAGEGGESGGLVQREEAV